MCGVYVADSLWSLSPDRLQGKIRAIVLRPCASQALHPFFPKMQLQGIAFLFRIQDTKLLHGFPLQKGQKNHAEQETQHTHKKQVHAHMFPITLFEYEEGEK